jgi:hypothetical protein
MFTQSTPTIDLKELNDFIEKPIQNFNLEKSADKDALEKNVAKVILVLSKNPMTIMNILIDPSRYYPTSNGLMLDLADKLKMVDQQNQIQLLFADEACFKLILKECIYNLYDLQHCVDMAPAYKNRLIEGITEDNIYFSRVLNSDEKVLPKLIHAYPDHSQRFNERSQELAAIPRMARCE